MQCQKGLAVEICVMQNSTTVAVFVRVSRWGLRWSPRFHSLVHPGTKDLAVVVSRFKKLRDFHGSLLPRLAQNVASFTFLFLNFYQ